MGGWVLGMIDLVLGGCTPEDGGGMNTPETMQRFRGVNCALSIGVRFVWNVATRSTLSSFPPSSPSSSFFAC
jgi:hypothetical protein